ncbi:MAG: hypothetical protein WBV59_00220 [Anaerolineae bacterium]
MPTPNLIVQHRELARSLRELQRQNEQSLDAIAAARDREIAAAEQARLDANRQYDARLAEFLESELIARSKIKCTSSQAFEKGHETASLTPIENPQQALGECVSGIERVLAEFANNHLLLKFTIIPSSVDGEAVVKKLEAMGFVVENKKCPTQGKFFNTSSIDRARKVIEEMKAFDIEMEIES